MKVCLIQPPRLFKLLSVTHKPAPPLGLAFIAGALQNAGHEVLVIDALGESPDNVRTFHDDIVLGGLSYEEIMGRIPFDIDVIGLSLMFSGNWLSNKQLIDLLGERFPKASIIAGGEHVTAIPEFCIVETRHLQVCVLGEGEETAVDLLNALKTKTDLSTVSGIVYRHGDQIISTRRRERRKTLEDLPVPAWHLFPLDEYYSKRVIYGVDRRIKSLPVLATRGCPYSCTFCSSPQMWGTQYYLRSPKHVADEIEYLKERFGATNFDFYDLTAIIKREWIIEFAKEILNRELKITWQIPAGTRSEAIDSEVARYLYLSGCRNITYAPETGSPGMLKNIKKKVVLPRMLESIRHSHREKINIKINMIIGFPDETHRNIWETLWFLIRASWQGVHDMSPAVFSPYPGSALFNRLVKEGKIQLTDDYFYQIAYSDTLFKSHFYNERVSWIMLRFYNLLYFLVFYGSNYLFRPSRFFRTLRNLVTSRFESRGEMVLDEIIRRNAHGIKQSRAFRTAQAIQIKFRALRSGRQNEQLEISPEGKPNIL